MSGTYTSLIVLEGILTAAAALMFLYRSMLDMREEDHVILDQAESHLAREQASIRQRVTAVSKYLKVVAIVWAVLLVVIFCLWVAHGLNMI